MASERVMVEPRGDTVCVDPLAPLRTVGGRLASPAEALAQAVAERVLGQVVGALDLNAMLAEIDLNAVLEKVDINRVLDRVDLDGLLGRVDLNAVIDRVDMNIIVQRVDLEALVEQTDLGSVIAKSSSGVASDVVDAVRSRTVGVDESIARLVARLRRRPYNGPPIPPARLRVGAAS
jgi:hypothetical protein